MGGDADYHGVGAQLPHIFSDGLAGIPPGERESNPRFFGAHQRPGVASQVSLDQTQELRVAIVPRPGFFDAVVGRLLGRPIGANDRHVVRRGVLERPDPVVDRLTSG
jgi:hypothetical protein